MNDSKSVAENPRRHRHNYSNSFGVNTYQTGLEGQKNSHKHDLKEDIKVIDNIHNRREVETDRHHTFNNENQNFTN